jgi:hypothetical protein
MKKTLLFAINLFMFSNLMFGQVKLDYDKDSKWFWGFNYGATWQTTDINYKLNHGWGLTLGKSFNYNYGKVVSFDIRGRFLTGNWYGQNNDSTQLPSSYKGVYSQIGTNYKDSLGFTILNFHSKINRLALELVIHANRVRETTGFDPYIFGGVGFTWHDTKANLKNDNSFGTNPIYNYDSLANYSANSLISLQDKTYETSINPYKPAFMPSLGFGLGYQVGKRVSIGVEHKTTFTQRDNFDGLIKSSKYKQDLYHYTSAYIRFQIRTSASRHENDRSNTTTTSNPPLNEPRNTQPSKQLPIVTFINPDSSGTNVNSANYVIRADIKYVDDRNHIEFKQENTTNLNFTYNASSHELVSNVVLQYGSNTFEITGTNQYGSDIKSTIIIYKRSEGVPPVVTITNPIVNPTTVSSQSYNFTSNVLNVDQSSQISILYNGKNFTSFKFNPITHNVTASLILQPGSNTILVKGINNFGTDSKTTTIIFERTQVAQPPVVTITNPSINPYSVANANFNLISTILNVTTQNQISVKFNGQSTTNFTFNSANHSIALPLNLIIGSNTISITGTNTVGADSKSTVINYQPVQQLLPPVVTFVTPAINPYNTNIQESLISATVTNVNSNAGINVLLNGRNFTNFTFNPTTHIVSFNPNLIDGSNIISITGTNSVGKDVKDQTINYVKPAIILPPVVTYIDPISSPVSVYSSLYNVQAKVLNVVDKQNIELKLNGVLSSSFTFNTTSKLIAFTINLQLGANVIELKGTNSAGQDMETTTIIYRKPEEKLPPLVTITNPTGNPYITNAATQNIDATVLNVDGQENIQIKVNGSLINNFRYNTTTKAVNFVANLVEGSNTIDVKGINTVGQSSDNKIIVYRKELVLPPPFVTFLNPLTSDLTVGKVAFVLRATVTNVTTISQIELKKEDRVINQSEYSFNPSTKEVVFKTNLGEGKNQFTVTGTNLAGTHTASTIIICELETPSCEMPIITFINPTSIPQEVISNIYTIKAKIDNINQISQVKAFVNGVEQAIGNYDPRIKIFTQTVTLLENSNTILINATNECGNLADQRLIFYKPVVAPCIQPTIQALSPSASRSETDVSKVNISAIVSNISDQNQITFLVNGVSKSFNFDLNRLVINSDNDLILGLNTFQIIIKNDCGMTTQNWEVNYIPCLEPKLTILNNLIPNFSTTKEENISIQLNTSNITNQSQLGVFCNEILIPFTFDLQKQLVIINRPLEEGVNNFLIRAINNCGRAAVQYKVSREQNIQVRPPSIDFVCPTKLIAGENRISGMISNVSNASEVSITVNNEAITSFNPIISERGLHFEFNIDVVNSVKEYVITVLARNSSGNDSKSCTGLTTLNILNPTENNNEIPSDLDITLPNRTNNGVVSPTQPRTPSIGRGGN